MASKKFLIFAISFIVSFFYFALRVLAGGGLEEATVSAVMLGGFLVIVTFANKLEKLSELSRIFDRSLRPWLSLLISLAVGVMAISNGKTIPLIMLDVFFAFFFFTCFFSIVFRLKNSAPLSAQQLVVSVFCIPSFAIRPGFSRFEIRRGLGLV